MDKVSNVTTLPAFSNGYAHRSGRGIRVVYRGFQGGVRFTREQAEQYLEWLDAGNFGRHWKMLGNPEKEVRVYGADYSLRAV